MMSINLQRHCPGHKIGVHVMVDTGLNREGLRPEDASTYVAENFYKNGR